MTDRFCRPTYLNHGSFFHLLATGFDTINFVELIAKKRDRRELTEVEIKNLIEGFSEGAIPDYQMAAFAMAVVLNGMSVDETVALTRAMIQSGEKLTWPNERSVVDKHSTGGIGDKVSLCLTPMLACCGVQVPMISGRGLGPTGGTLDKLESIPGYRTDLAINEIQEIVERVGCVITGANEQLAPADRKLYALRDVTGTVESIPLITASIISKKAAAGLNALVLDVKFGSGAFMKTTEEAYQLARSLVTVGNYLGIRTTALLTDMNQTLGWSAGNAIEVEESFEVLNGRGPDDLAQLSVELGAHVLDSAPDGSFNSPLESLGSNKMSLDSYRELLRSTLHNGQAASKFWEMVRAQGGSSFEFDGQVVDEIIADQDGFLESLNAREIGLANIDLGAGRKTKDDVLDLSVGIRQLVRLGESVSKGQSIFQVISKTIPEPSSMTSARSRLKGSFKIAKAPVTTSELIDRVVSHDHLKKDNA